MYGVSIIPVSLLHHTYQSQASKTDNNTFCRKKREKERGKLRIRPLFYPQPTPPTYSSYSDILRGSSARVNDIKIMLHFERCDMVFLNRISDTATYADDSTPYAINLSKQLFTDKTRKFL